jgi:membrane protease YdiL (CAAX protease family)
LRGFGPLGLLAVLVILAAALAGSLVSAALVLAWAWLSRTPPRALGFTTPRSWTLTVAGGAAFGIAFKLAMKAVVMPLFGAPPINAPYHFLAGNAAALPEMLAAVVISGGFAEEVFFRGYLFERLGKLFGRGSGGLLGAVALTSALFAIAHYHVQGFPGVEQALITGLVFGGLFAWRKEIWPVMVVHAAFDVTAIALIYWGFEEQVAHLLFR